MAARTLPSNVTMSPATQVASVLKPDGTLNTGTYVIYADRAIWDTTNNVYLYPGRDFDPYKVFRD